MTNTPVALVTGANKGLGKAVAGQLAKLGMTVLLGSRDPSRGKAAAADLAAVGLNVVPVVLDVTDTPSIEAVAALVGREHGRLDVLVNNAAILRRIPTLAVIGDDLVETFETNVYGLLTVTHTMLPLLREASAPRIVNVASTSASHAHTADPESMFAQSDTSLGYAASKAAVTMLTAHYANAFRRSAHHAHIKVNSATPGYLATDLNGHRGTRTPAQGARVVVSLATLPADGPSGGFFDEDGPVPW
ncbi:SDR family NAD(P)-dependent oxidoreductase [Actinopolymorpha pittospori]